MEKQSKPADAQTCSYIDVIAKRLRTLNKRLAKLDKIEEDRRAGKKLEQEQLEALTKKMSVHEMKEELESLLRQLQQVSAEEAKAAKKAKRRQVVEMQNGMAAAVRTYAAFNAVVAALSTAEGRAYFLNAENAGSMSEEEVSALLELSLSLSVQLSELQSEALESDEAEQQSTTTAAHRVARLHLGKQDAAIGDFSYATLRARVYSAVASPFFYAKTPAPVVATETPAVETSAVPVEDAPAAAAVVDAVSVPVTAASPPVTASSSAPTPSASSSAFPQAPGSGRPVKAADEVPSDTAAEATLIDEAPTAAVRRGRGRGGRTGRNANEDSGESEEPKQPRRGRGGAGNRRRGRGGAGGGDAEGAIASQASSSGGGGAKRTAATPTTNSSTSASTASVAGAPSFAGAIPVMPRTSTRPPPAPIGTRNKLPPPPGPPPSARS